MPRLETPRRERPKAKSRDMTAFSFVAKRNIHQQLQNAIANRRRPCLPSPALSSPAPAGQGERDVRILGEQSRRERGYAKAHSQKEILKFATMLYFRANKDWSCAATPPVTFRAGPATSSPRPCASPSPSPSETSLGWCCSALKNIGALPRARTRAGWGRLPPCPTRISPSSTVRSIPMRRMATSGELRGAAHRRSHWLSVSLGARSCRASGANKRQLSLSYAALRHPASPTIVPALSAKAGVRSVAQPG